MKSHASALNAHCGAVLRPPPRLSVDEWCERNFYLPSPQTQSPGFLRFDGREFMREPLRCFNSPEVRDVVLAFGSQVGKTTIFMGGVAWCIACDPCGFLWVMPSKELAQSFAETRWLPVLRSSARLAELLPTGAARHSVKTLQQQVGGAMVNFVGSNSPGNLASRPARRVILDEVDKFAEATEKEADAVNLAEQRTKAFANPQRWKSSTPTISEGLIWQEFTKGDQRRRFVPCPACGKFVVLAWSKAFTVFPKLGCEAFVRWDKEAKRPDGSWDLDRVERSSRFECPHCAAHIRDEQKTAMDRGGEWRATAVAVSGFRSYHLPSLYAATPETTVGRIAVVFLQAKASLLGLHGFINGNLAEPYQAQDTLGDRVELVAPRVVTEDGTKLMTVDCQAKTPAFYWIVREWRRGSCQGIAAGTAETWDEIAEMQRAHGVADAGLAVDSGWGARSDREVYATCVSHGEIMPRDGKLPAVLGWMPTKGSPGRRSWRDENGLFRPYYVRDVDPFEGTSDARKLAVGLLGFSTDSAKDILEGMRRKQGPFAWSVCEAMATEEYWRHMDGEIKTAVRNMANGRVTHNWVPRSRHWPNHWFDCEVLQVVLAMFLGIFETEQPTNQPTKKDDATPTE